MGLTLVEKIAARHADGLAAGAVVRAGDFVSIRPRHVMTHDNTGAVIPKFKQIGATAIADRGQPPKWCALAAAALLRAWNFTSRRAGPKCKPGPSRVAIGKLEVTVVSRRKRVRIFRRFSRRARNRSGYFTPRLGQIVPVVDCACSNAIN